MSTPICDEQLSYLIIGKAMEAHRELGPGVDEVFYHELLAERLQAAGIEHLFKPRKALVHRGQIADIFEPDLVIPNRIISELKRLWGSFARGHFVQLKAYLKHWRITDGLLLDFGKESLVLRRYIFHDKSVPRPDVKEAMARAPAHVTLKLGRELVEAVARLTQAYGLGYRDTTYRSLIDIELRCEGIHCIATPMACVRAAAKRLGDSLLPCLAVENQCAVMVLSQRDDIRAADRAILQSWLKHLDFRWGLIVHFAKTEVELRWVSSQVA